MTTEGFARDFHPRDKSNPAYGSLEWTAARVLELEDKITEQQARMDEMPEQFAQAIAAALGPVMKDAVKQGVAEALEQEVVVTGFLRNVLEVTSKQTRDRVGGWSMAMIGRGMKAILMIGALLMLAALLGGWPLMVKVWHLLWATE